MRRLLYILIFCSVFCKAQDKLFFNNGSTKTGIIVSMGKHVVYFKDSDTAVAQSINKLDLMMAEDYKGTRYIFGDEAVAGPLNPGSAVIYKNSIGVQPLGFFMGRAVFTYERLSADGKVGVVFPLLITFNPGYNLTKVDTFNVIHRRNINVMAGIEINFYPRPGERAQFFIGPRFRYGTDVFLQNTEGYTAQTQCGWKFENPDSRFVQHISFGFGFMKIVSSSGITGGSNRTWACYSFNYRLGIRW